MPSAAEELNEDQAPNFDLRIMIHYMNADRPPCGTNSYLRVRSCERMVNRITVRGSEVVVDRLLLKKRICIIVQTLSNHSIVYVTDRLRN